MCKTTHGMEIFFPLQLRFQKAIQHPGSTETYGAKTVIIHKIRENDKCTKKKQKVVSSVSTEDSFEA